MMNVQMQHVAKEGSESVKYQQQCSSWKIAEVLVAEAEIADANLEATTGQLTQEPNITLPRCDSVMVQSKNLDLHVQQAPSTKEEEQSKNPQVREVAEPRTIGKPGVSTNVELSIAKPSEDMQVASCDEVDKTQRNRAQCLRCVTTDEPSKAQDPESSGSRAGEDLSGYGTTPTSSTSPSDCELFEPCFDSIEAKAWISDSLTELYAENVIAKALRTAQVAIAALPSAFPETCPHEDGHDGSYSLREADFWTCGFFPGTLSLVLERLIKYPQSIQVPHTIHVQTLREQFKILTRTWSEPLRGMDGRTDTHDIGFIIMPALRSDWELLGDQRSLQSIVKAARSLATRFVPSAGAIRSWDLLKKKDIEILDQEENMIVIIDSMCNLDLLYYAAHHAQDPSLSSLATEHAITLLDSHLRKEPVLSASKDVYQGQWYSTCHVANIDPKTGHLKRRLTAQGYEHNSTWSRGQAWGILGYAETYTWTKDRRFLQASCGLAEFFLHRMETAPTCVTRGRYVPLWDFDAPIEDPENPLRDSSAGVIAANGMLVLSQALTSINQVSLSKRYREAAVRIVQDTLHFALAPERACLVPGAYHSIQAKEAVLGQRYDGILKYGTANNNRNARKRYANHGLVYGDYYLVEFGNRLLRMGLC